jgi:hypothetical protein
MKPERRFANFTLTRSHRPTFWLSNGALTAKYSCHAAIGLLASIYSALFLISELRRGALK